MRPTRTLDSLILSSKQRLSYGHTLSLQLQKPEYRFKIDQLIYRQSVDFLLGRKASQSSNLNVIKAAPKYSHPKTVNPAAQRNNGIGKASFLFQSRGAVVSKYKVCAFKLKSKINKRNEDISQAEMEQPQHKSRQQPIKEKPSLLPKLIQSAMQSKTTPSPLIIPSPTLQLRYKRKVKQLTRIPVFDF